MRRLCDETLRALDLNQVFLPEHENQSWVVAIYFVYVLQMAIGCFGV